MPGAMPRTSTFALTNATVLYIRKIASLGIKDAIRENPLLKDGVNIYKGQVTFEPVATSLDLPYHDLDELL
jgi:alanine dehydrogenase